MPARRCSLCGLNWPTSHTGKCLECGDKLDYVDSSDAMSTAEFQRRKAYFEFELWCEKETPAAREKREAKWRWEQEEALALELARSLDGL